MTTPTLEAPPVVDPQLSTPSPESVIAEPELIPAVAGEGVVTEPIPAAITPAPVPTVPVAPSAEVIQLRRQLALVEAERQAAITEATLQREFEAVYRDELAQGQSEADALRIARRHHALSRRVGQEEQRVREQAQSEQGKRNAAASFGAQYGVDPSLLMVANTPQDMEMLAQREKRYAGLEAQVKGLVQARVPAQTLNAPNGGGTPGAVASGANIDKLWMDHEIQHPGENNPYEAQYRKLVNRR